MTVIAETVDGGGSFVAHATVTDADSAENGRFDCRLEGPRAAEFQLRRLYATEFVVATAAPLSDAAQPETEAVGAGLETKADAAPKPEPEADNG